MAQKFNFLDQNKSGKIDYAAPEMDLALQSILDLTDAEVEELKSAFRRIDEDNDGKVDYASFVAAGMNRHIQVSKQNLHSAFDAIAENGLITKAALIRNFQLAKPRAGEIEYYGDEEETKDAQEEARASQTQQAEEEAKWQRIIGKYQLGDGDTINFETFEEIMKKRSKSKQH